MEKLLLGTIGAYIMPSWPFLYGAFQMKKMAKSLKGFVPGGGASLLTCAEFFYGSVGR